MPPEAEDLADGLRQQYIGVLPPDTESLRRPRLYMDLRPFVDTGPLTVRRVYATALHAMCWHSIVSPSSPPGPFA